MVERYRYVRDDLEQTKEFVEELREFGGEESLIALIEADQRVRRMPTDADVQVTFNRYDQSIFQGVLNGGTRVELDPKLCVGNEDGATKHDGSVIYLNPNILDWEYVLIHEMVHAFEFRYPSAVDLSVAGQSLAQSSLLNALYQSHSALFFSKLFAVMTTRGHSGDWMFLYFG